MVPEFVFRRLARLWRRVHEVRQVKRCLEAASDGSEQRDLLRHTAAGHLLLLADAHETGLKQLGCVLQRYNQQITHVILSIINLITAVVTGLKMLMAKAFHAFQSIIRQSMNRIFFLNLNTIH